MKNFAFISYNHKDVKHAQWLQKKLESYKLPAEIHNEFEDTRFIRPVFRDQTDLNTGILANTLRDQLEDSKFLIVLCSPNSAQSEWVSKEVESFIKWGRLDCIIPLIVDGQPNCYNPDLECFPRYLREYTKEHPEAELLGVSFAEVGKDKAFIRVVSKMLDVSFDTLWQRHERARRRRNILIATFTPIILFLLYWLIVPVRLSVTLHDADHHLPVAKSYDGSMGVLTINGVDHNLTSLDTTIHSGLLPGYRRLSTASVTFVPEGYYLSDSLQVKLGAGVGNTCDLQLVRDDSFAHFEGHLYDAQSREPLAEAVLTLDGNPLLSATTDAEGHFDIVIPVAEQTVSKHLHIQCAGYETIDFDDEVVDRGLGYTMKK